MLTKFWTGWRVPQRRRGRLKTPTALPIFAVGALLLAGGMYGAWRVHRLHRRGQEILSENVASIRSAEELESIVREVHYRLKRYLSSGDVRHLNIADEQISVGDGVLGQVASLATSGREQQLVERIRDGYQRLSEQLRRLQQEHVRPPQAGNVAGIAGDVNPDEVFSPDEVVRYTEQYKRLNEQTLDRSNQRNRDTASRLMLGLLLLGTCGGVAGLLAGYGMSRLVSRTVVQLAIPVRDAAGKLNQVAGPVAVAAEPELEDLESVLRTVSDHVTTVVERLQESERDRLRAEQLAAVGQLAAGLAHELRNPLTSMKAILQLAEHPGDLSRRDLDILQQETGRLEQSIQSLLDFARPPQPQKADTDLGELLQQTARLVQRRAQRQGISLRYRSREADLHLLADAGQLRQVLLNLLLNAIDVTPRGGQIQVECGLEKPSVTSAAGNRGDSGRAAAGQDRSGWAVIHVSDSGPGLPRMLGQRIFEPFVTSKETGTGLGLSICRRIVESHGGQIVALDGPCGGAVFEIRLPHAMRHCPLPAPNI